MHTRTVAVRTGIITIGVVAGLLCGCVGDFLFNLVETRDGNALVLVVNNTDFRAAFTMGSYNQFELNPATDADWQQPSIEARTTGQFTITCDRVTALGTARLIERLVVTDVPTDEVIDEDSFTELINFSSAPADSDAPTAANVGTATGLEVRLGVDYACGDQLIFTLEQDANAPGGFRVDFELLQSRANQPDYGL